MSPTTTTPRQTADETFRIHAVLPQQQTPLPSTLQRHNWALLFDVSNRLRNDVAAGHAEARGRDIDERSRRYAVDAPTNVLDEVATRWGVSWTDLADLLDVSVSALRKWRSGADPSPEKRAALARLAAFMELLEEAAVQRPAGWLQIPIREGWTTTPADLYKSGYVDAALDFAQQRMSANDALTVFDAEWVVTRRKSHRVITTDDGLVGLVPTDR